MKKIFNQYFLPVLAGFLIAFSYPNKLIEANFITAILGLVIIMKIMTGSGKKLLPAILFFISFGITGCYWVPQTLTEFGGIPYILSLLLSLVFYVFSLPHYAIFFALIHKLKIKGALNLATMMTLLEIIVPQQFPITIGETLFALHKYLSLTPILGASVYSFVLFFFTFEIVEALHEHNIKKLIPSSVTILAIALFGAIFPIQYIGTDDLTVRLVQANIGNNLLISSDTFAGAKARTTTALYTELSLKDLNGVDLVVWPETAIPGSMSSKAMMEQPLYIPKYVQAVTETSTLLTGGYDRDFDNDELFNSAYFFSNKQLQDVYHKRHLIPFGEYIPFAPLNRLAKRLIPNMGFFTIGTRLPLFKVSNYKFMSPICYEVLFPRVIATHVNATKDYPDFMVNISNDSWYGNTSEPYQHRLLTHWRSLEFGIPIIRMTNTGISSILYPDGSESERTPIFQRAIVDRQLHIKKGERTIFSRLGNSFNVFVLIVFLLLRNKSFFKKIVKTKEA